MTTARHGTARHCIAPARVPPPVAAAAPTAKPPITYKISKTAVPDRREPTTGTHCRPMWPFFACEPENQQKYEARTNSSAHSRPTVGPSLETKSNPHSKNKKKHK